MTEAATSTEPDIEFGFMLIKQTDGKVALQKIENVPEADIDQIYSACEALCRNITASQIAGAVAAQMVQAASVLSDKSSGGVVLPHKRNTPKR